MRFAAMADDLSDNYRYYNGAMHEDVLSLQHAYRWILDVVTMMAVNEEMKDHLCEVEFVLSHDAGVTVEVILAPTFTMDDPLVQWIIGRVKIPCSTSYGHIVSDDKWTYMAMDLARDVQYEVRSAIPVEQGESNVLGQDSPRLGEPVFP